MRYTYICCLEEGCLGNILGTYNLVKLEKLGYDASRLFILEVSPMVRLRIYKESKKAQQDILQSMYRKEQMVIHPSAIAVLFPGSRDIGEGLVVSLEDASEKLVSEFLKAFGMDRLHVTSSEQYQDLFIADLSHIIVRALFRRIDARMSNIDGVYTLEWGALKHPLIS